ncbi:MAG: head maturation protease, ClpP-related [Cyanobacteriota bacterium]
MTSIFLYGDVGADVSVQDLSQELAKANGGDVSLNVFSYGGDAGQGLAMYNLLQRYAGRITAHIDGVVASAGTLPVMAANRVIMPSNALMMIHDPWAGAMGNASGLRKKAEQLDAYSSSYREAYAKRSGRTLDEVAAWMGASNGGGTWFSAAQALEAGLVDEISPPAEVRAEAPTLDQARFHGMVAAPEALRFWVQAKVTTVQQPEMDPETQAVEAPVTNHPAEASATVANGLIQAASPVVQVSASAPAASADVSELVRLRRENDIRTAAAHAGLAADKVQALIDSGQPMAQVAIEIIRAQAAASDALAPGAGHPARLSVGRTSGDSVKASIQARIVHRLSPGSAMPDEARQFRGCTMLDLVRASMEMHGVNPVGRTKTELAVWALHSTSDFPLLLESAANKTLMPAYEEEPHTWRQIATQRNLPDFKEAKSYSIAADLIPKELKEGGKYESATMSEGRASWRLYTYARSLLLSREMLINDDLSAFQEALPMFGRGFRRFESNTIYSLITSNANSAEDGVALFHADHNNMGTGAISIPNIALGRKAMRKQKDLAGNTINLEPAFLLGPSDLEDEILQFLYPNGYAPSALTGANGVHPYVGKMQPIIEPRLDGSATQWYLVASPNRIPGIMFGYLEDEPGPTVTSETIRDPDGLKILARLDFGCAIRDHRAFYRSSGT